VEHLLPVAVTTEAAFTAPHAVDEAAAERYSGIAV